MRDIGVTAEPRLETMLSRPNVWTVQDANHAVDRQGVFPEVGGLSHRSEEIMWLAPGCLRCGMAPIISDLQCPNTNTGVRSSMTNC
jgi:hypothetical protein